MNVIQPGAIETESNPNGGDFAQAKEILDRHGGVLRYALEDSSPAVELSPRPTES